MASEGGRPFPILSDALNQLGHQLHADLTEDVCRHDAARHFENNLLCTLNQAQQAERVPLFSGPSRLVPQCGGCAIYTAKKPIRQPFRYQQNESRRLDNELGPTESDPTDCGVHQQNPQIVQKVTSKLSLNQKQERNYGKNATKTVIGHICATSKNFLTQDFERQQHRNKMDQSAVQRMAYNVKHTRVRKITRSGSQVAVSLSRTDIHKHDKKNQSYLTPKQRPEKVVVKGLQTEECNYGRVEKKYSENWDRNNKNEPYRKKYSAPIADVNDTPNIETPSIHKKAKKTKTNHRHCLSSEVENATITAPLIEQLLYAPVELQTASESAVKSVDRTVGALERLALLAPKNLIDKKQLKTIQLMCTFLRQFHTELRSKRDRATKLEMVLQMWSILQAHGNQGQLVRPATPPSNGLLPMTLSNSHNVNNRHFNRPTSNSTGEELTIKPANMSPTNVQVDFMTEKEKHQKLRRF